MTPFGLGRLCLLNVSLCLQQPVFTSIWHIRNYCPRRVTA
jgi:hypothetical protein